LEHHYKIGLSTNPACKILGRLAHASRRSRVEKNTAGKTQVIPKTIVSGRSNNSCNYYVYLPSTGNITYKSTILSPSQTDRQLTV